MNRTAVSAEAPSVCGLLADLHAHRVATMSPAELQVNIDQRRELEETADRSRFIKTGDIVERFSLPEVHGGTVDLDRLLLSGPVVLMFFRYESCPACNIALPHYQKVLYPALYDLGVTLVAISPQVPDKLVAIKDRLGLATVASDVDNSLARRFGITFTSNAASRKLAMSKGSDLGLTLGTGKWELPMPAVVVIDGDHVVRFADIHPDWMVRTEADVVIDAVSSCLDLR
jgi:peroxiredoxin